MKMEPANEEYWVLNYLNAHRNKEDLITKENAKGRYMPKERFYMGRTHYKGGVNRVLGEPSHLERAEMMLLEIEEGEISREQKYENIISIAYAITNACGMDLDGNNPVAEKYGMVHSHIPIKMCQINRKKGFLNFEKEETTVSAGLLQAMRARIYLQEKILLADEEKIFFEYIFELAYISLKEIFEEVKAEIIGK